MALLTESIDAETIVVSSDHGNAMGELGIYGHPENVRLDAVRRVPWYETSGTDSGAYTPPDIDTTDSGSDVEDRLDDLGYLG